MHHERMLGAQPPKCLQWIVLAMIAAPLPSLFAQVSPYPLDLESDHPPRATADATLSALRLPEQGTTWAVDESRGSQILLHIRHTTLLLDNKTPSWFVPAAYKPGKEVGLAGPAAHVRLHTLTPVIYLRAGRQDTLEDDLGPTQWRVRMVRAKVKKGVRTLNTAAFLPTVQPAAQSPEVVEIKQERLSTDPQWIKLTPRQALSPGEYALTALLNQQGVYTTTVYDFAIDPEARQRQPTQQSSDAKQSSPASNPLQDQ